ncbi:MAG: aminotransferase class I/II-fold pyridoxal phosphate-dependent enzyme [Clostridia bacterium]|nr:aminotransferase class I/II-fold pyridoxal phosphate-dependent enzyme [Clostridia bacterium]
MQPLNQDKTPLYDALRDYINDKIIPFHVPAHKQGRGNSELLKIFGESTVQMDLTSMEDLDNICNPQGVIKEAEKLAAALYKADNAFFLVNGTTSGIQAMIMSVCQPGDKIILPRNAHKSAIGGIILSGAHPIYIEPEIDPLLGVAMGVTVEKVREILELHPDAKGLLIINSTYYGITSNLQEIVNIAHGYNVPVLVDEAHGAHFAFHEELPLSGMEAGADLVASSTHKLIGSLTQSSILLHKGSLVSSKYVKAVLNLTQTTSSSYILLASLDLARRDFALNGKEKINHALRLATKAKEELKKVEGLYVVDRDILDNNGKYDLDPIKLVINVRDLGFSGYEVERILRSKYKIQVELSDLYNIITMITIGDNEETLNTLIKALKEIAQSRDIQKIVRVSTPIPHLPEQQVLPKDAFYGESHLISLAEAEGEISAEMIMAYPPGIPIICPGERITKEIVDYIQLLHKEEAILQGTQDPQVKNIKVLNSKLALLPNNESTQLNVG